ncbi:hypothetical protein DBV15_01470 [Temnothorax longispinosus]|uniref:Reverse transcriptase domain-containing protein n=1 Tax=Temnothorax longispinosus TaxID=300112 RepID=A0A4S2KU44_9HYME|nr:hypothetical protein DBV15_01470 [Temnothorax longispinosus]
MMPVPSPGKGGGLLGQVSSLPNVKNDIPFKVLETASDQDELNGYQPRNDQRQSGSWQITQLHLTKLYMELENNEEQMEYQRNRSTTDAIYVIRQIVEKAIKYNSPAFMCFVDLSKAFDRVNKKIRIKIKC